MCRIDTVPESQSNLKTLTEGIHSKEALDLVREHVLGVMGSASMAYSNTMLKMSKLQVGTSASLNLTAVLVRASLTCCCQMQAQLECRQCGNISMTWLVKANSVSAPVDLPTQVFQCIGCCGIM